MYNAKETAKTENFVSELSQLSSDVRNAIKEIMQGKSIKVNEGTIFYNKAKERFIYRKDVAAESYKRDFPKLYAFMLRERISSIELTPKQLIDYISKRTSENVY